MKMQISIMITLLISQVAMADFAKQCAQSKDRVGCENKTAAIGFTGGALSTAAIGGGSAGLVLADEKRPFTDIFERYRSHDIEPMSNSDIADLSQRIPEGSEVFVHYYPEPMQMKAKAVKEALDRAGRLRSHWDQMEDSLITLKQIDVPPFIIDLEKTKVRQAKASYEKAFKHFNELRNMDPSQFEIKPQVMNIRANSNARNITEFLSGYSKNKRVFHITRTTNLKEQGLRTRRIRGGSAVLLVVGGIGLTSSIAELNSGALGRKLTDDKQQGWELESFDDSNSSQ